VLVSLLVLIARLNLPFEIHQSAMYMLVVGYYCNRLVCALDLLFKSPSWRGSFLIMSPLFYIVIFIERIVLTLFILNGMDTYHPCRRSIGSVYAEGV
jgi:hypothetical protein